MSQDNTKQSWSQLFGSIVNKAADANLNPLAYVKAKQEEKASTPVPVEKEAAQAQFEEAKAKLKLAKDRVAITGKASATLDEVEAVGAKLMELGFEEQGKAFQETATLLRNVMSQ